VYKNSGKIDLNENGSHQSIKIEDKASLEKIYRKYWFKLYIYAFNVLKEREICEDIVQEIFIDLWVKKDKIIIFDINSYLYQSVKYQIFNHFRRCKYKKHLLMKFESMNKHYEIDELYEKKELKTNIGDIISRLPRQRRIIFQMSKYEGLSNKEISRSLNISVQTVKNQISASIKFIRKSLKNVYLFFI
jgi:RNA polymerase sigma-70 factor (family 1)